MTTALNRTTIATKLQKYCNDNQVSKRTLSLRAGLGEKAVSDIICGNSRIPKPETIEALSIATGIPVATLSEGISFTSKPPTLEDVIQHVLNSNDLTKNARDEIIQSINRYARLRTQSSDLIPADIREVNRFFGEKSFAKLGFRSAKTMSNFKSNVVRGIKMLPNMGQGATTRNLPDTWKHLLNLFDKGHDQAPFSALFRYAAEHNLSPEDIDDEVISAFRTYRHETASSKGGRNPDRIIDEAIGKWNKAVIELRDQGWPQTILTKRPDQRKVFDIEADAFPRLREEFERYAAWASGKMDRNGTPDTIKPSSRYIRKDGTARKRSLGEKVLKRHWGNLLLSAKTQATRGTPIENMQTIRACVEPEAVRNTLIAIEDRHSGKPDRSTPYEESSYSLQVAKDLRSMANWWCQLPQEDIEEIDDLVEQSKQTVTGKTGNLIQKRGMTEKNRRLLRQFEDPLVADAFVSLPEELFQSIEQERKRRSAVTDSMAIAMENTVMLTILIWVLPLRPENLTNIHIDQNLTAPFRRKEDGRIHFSIDEMKNDIDLTRSVPADIWKTIQTYIEHYRPIRVKKGDEDNPFLFPGQGDKKNVPLSQGALSDRLCLFVENKIGIQMNMQLFRHAIGYLMYKADPTSLIDISKVLGHRSIKTTIEYYVELEIDISAKVHDTLLKSYKKNKPGRPRKIFRGNKK